MTANEESHLAGPSMDYLLNISERKDGETEEQFDERLRLEAKELGITLHSRPTSSIVPTRPQSIQTLSFEMPRRSNSSASRASRASASTGLTSFNSEHSREHSFASSKDTRRHSRASQLSFRDYDAFLARGVSNGRNSISFNPISPLSTPSQSVFSLPLSEPDRTPESSPKKHFRRLRGLGMLKRITSSQAVVTDYCPHCPPDVMSQRRAVHKLPCGHRLCTQALRSTISAATENPTGAVPSCCGMPVPGGMVENVMTEDEQNALLAKLEEWDEAIAIVPTYPPHHASPPVMHDAPTISTPSSPPTTTIEPSLLDQILQRPDYLALRTAHLSQRAAFLSHHTHQRRILSAQHERLRSSMLAAQTCALEGLHERHSQAMCEAEDKQVAAEADLRALQAAETRDSATALAHMQAFCLGALRSDGRAHHRPVTPAHRAELEKAERHRAALPARQLAAINVLRGEQSRRIRLRAGRQENEVRELLRQQRKEELELERGCSAEVGRLEDEGREKKARLEWRWELQRAVLGKKIEGEVGAAVDVRCLPGVGWEDEETGGRNTLVD